MTRLVPIFFLAITLALTSSCQKKNLAAVELKPEEILPFDIQTMQAFYRINLEQARSLIKNNRQVLIVDLRTEEEFAKGHIPGANNFDLYFERDGQEGIANFGFQQNMGVVDRSMKVLIYDNGGFENSLALEATHTLKPIGFQEVYHFVGGLDEWTDAGLPTVTDLAMAE